MKFCLERFEVGIWTSAKKSRHNVDGALTFAIGEESKNKLLFIWDQSHCFYCIDPNGELCEYLKGVAEAEDVQSYVKDNAFGLPPLTSTHPHWSYYTQIFTSQFLNFWSAGK
ncbi:hypothetical protein MtrunA17_Chr7g0265671 [Medicago truncatula]|uniref:FCP1 homology domain-containing protein n=1 Tax=Medicago truncatula TaxID=3880 RepID=A0A396H9Y3_MEDTR|nr:hypothetical protein MtrunA17_Chr7g0265671 [Medicago truncatula]